MSETARQLAIGELVTWQMDGHGYCGNVVTFDHARVAVTFVQRVTEAGNEAWPNPILFVDRTTLRNILE